MKLIKIIKYVNIDNQKRTKKIYISKLYNIERYQCVDGTTLLNFSTLVQFIKL